MVIFIINYISCIINLRYIISYYIIFINNNISSSILFYYTIV